MSIAAGGGLESKISFGNFEILPARGEAKLILEILNFCLRTSIAAQGGLESKNYFGNFEILPQEEHCPQLRRSS